MPKQVQYTKNDIVNASIEILRSQGSEALTARTIGKQLGCSVGPLFRTFSNMDDLMNSVREKSEEIFRKYISDSVYYRPAFKEFGMRLIRFAKENPNLFHYLVLAKGNSNYIAHEVARDCLKQTAADFGLTVKQTDFVFEQIWPYACGLAQLCSKNPETYTEKRVSQLLSNQFAALLMLVKSGREVINPEPYLIPDGEHVYLRKWRNTDAEALFDLASDPDLGPRAGWPPHQSVEESLDTIRKVFSTDTMWAVVLKSSGKIVGCVGYLLPGMSNIPLGPDEAEVGYWIAKPNWNQGLCTEALNLVIEHCKMLGTINTLYGDHFTDNPASGRVMEKCGFMDTGERRTCSGLMVGSEKEVRVLKKSLR